jgi:hypothetical protein
LLISYWPAHPTVTIAINLSVQPALMATR